MEFGALLSTSTLIARLVLGSTLIWAGIAKARQLDTFEIVIRDFGLANHSLSLAAARLIPVIECAVGLLILSGLGSHWAAIGAVVLLGIFTFVIVRNLLNGRHLPCLCFGNNGNAVGWWTIHRNVGLILVGAVIVVAPEIPLSLDAIVLSDGHGAIPTVKDSCIAVATAILVILTWLGIGEAFRSLMVIFDGRPVAGR